MNRKHHRLQAKFGRSAAPSRPGVEAAIRQTLADAVHHHQAGRLAEAETLYREILDVQPDHADALHLLGVVARRAGRYDLAVDLIRQAIAVNDGVADFHYNLGNALVQQGRPEEAIAAYRRAMAIEPRFVDAHINIGTALMDMGRLAAAEQEFRAAIAVCPDHAPAHYNLGLALRRHNRLEEAAAAYRQAIAVRPDFREAHRALGIVLKEQCRLDEAIAACRAALAVDPDYAPALDDLLVLLNYAHDLPRERVFEAHRGFGLRHDPAGPAPLSFREDDPDPGRRLRVGYVSPDFHRHGSSHFIEQVLAAHDRAVVEVFCYAELDRPDAASERLRRNADAWRATGGLDDDALAQLIREDRIDILVDLAGHTVDNRLLVFTRRPAPVQVTWPGYPNTTGLSSIDAILAHPALIAPGEERFYSERVHHLPRLACCGRPEGTAPQCPPPPCLGGGPVTFGFRGNPIKIGPGVVEAWSTILHRVPDSRLVLSSRQLGQRGTREVLTRGFAAHGIGDGRLVLAKPSPEGPSDDCRHIDVALETFPCDGGATALEALWMGVPTVALRGDRWAGRVAAAVLEAIGRHDLVTTTVESYVALAVTLGRDRERLAAERPRLQAALACAAFLDIDGLTRDVEAAYREMWRRWCVR
ncbi:MAG: tetratricopeptide repeat protein [Alphaproteobacteria bacterium]